MSYQLWEVIYLKRLLNSLSIGIDYRFVILSYKLDEMLPILCLILFFNIGCQVNVNTHIAFGISFQGQT